MWRKTSIWLITIQLAISFTVSVWPRQALGDALDLLHWRNPSPSGNDFVGVVFGAGKFIAVDKAGYVFLTTDGISWTTASFSTVANPIALAYGGGKFVITGEAGEIGTSADGAAWVSRESGTTNSLVSVAYGNGTFVAVGNRLGPGAGPVLGSEDGISWTDRTGNVSVSGGYSLRQVVFGNGKFLTISSESAVFVSTNGTTWTASPAIPGLRGGISAGFGGDLFLVSGFPTGLPNLGPKLWISTDALDWTVVAGKTASGKYAYGNNLHVEFGGYFVSGSSITGLATSPDAINWTYRNPPESLQPLSGVAFGNGIFVCVGNNGAVGRSVDGVVWIAASTGDRAINVASAAYGAGRYVLVGAEVVTSTDGVSFQRLSGGPANLHAVIFAGGKFVALGTEPGVIHYSADGLTWSKTRSGTLKLLKSLVYANGRYVAVGAEGTVRLSDNALVWREGFSGVGYELTSVTHAQGKFVAVGDYGVVLTSTDGFDWSPQYTDDLGALTSVAYGGGKFVSAGNSLLVSSDGVTWSKVSGVTGPRRIIFDGNNFIATGEGSSYFVSADGLNWVTRFLPAANVKVDLLNGRYLVYGGSSILQSDPVGAVVLSAASNPSTSLFEVRISGGQIGVLYRLQSCTDLAANVWTDVTTFTQTQPITVVPVPGGVGAPQCYYRAVSP